jgi:deoxyribonuclease-4
MARFIGGHPINNGGIDMAIRRAANAGMTAVQVFTAPPQYYGDRSTIRPERVQRFQKALGETSIQPRMVQVHAAYVLNVASDNPEMWGRAAGGLRKEMERSCTLGVGGVCFHPGSAKGPKGEAAERVARAMTAAIEACPGTTRLLVENTAGAGSTFGRSPAEIGDVLARIPPEHRPRAGYGLDTCHLFASGYDLRESPEALAHLLDEFIAACGEPPSFFHLNDSEGELGTNRDRHTLIGEGKIGTEPFRWLMHDPRTDAIPLLLETPEEHYDIADDDASADPWDKRMVELLRSML